MVNARNAAKTEVSKYDLHRVHVRIEPPSHLLEPREMRACDPPHERFARVMTVCRKAWATGKFSLCGKMSMGCSALPEPCRIVDGCEVHSRCTTHSICSGTRRIVKRKCHVAATSI